MYAADRAQPIVPERHEDKSEDAELEALKAQKEKLDVKKGAAEEEVARDLRTHHVELIPVGPQRQKERR